MKLSINSFANNLKTWRKSNLLSQKELAAKLGVSQQAISIWETGDDFPSKEVFNKIADMMSYSEELNIDRVFIKDQDTIRALIDTDGARLVGYSKGFETLWADFCQLYDVPLEDKMINELQAIVSSGENKRQILKGQLIIASGISLKHIDVELGAVKKHKWHVCFKRYGTRIIGDMIFEPCAENEETGIGSLIRKDEITSKLD